MGTFVVDKSTLAMKLLNFIEQFPDKDNCKLKYKEVCDEIGVMIKNQSIYKTTCTSFDINITDSILGDKLFDRLLIACVSYKNES